MREMYPRFPMGHAKVFTLSYDDGVEQDVRFLELLRVYGAKATFHLNANFPPEDIVHPAGAIHRRMPARRCKQVYGDPSAEVAAHPVTHPRLETLPNHLAAWELIEDRLRLERLFGHPVTGFAYPYGSFSEQTLAVLRATRVFDYARDTVSTHDFELPGDWLQLHSTCHHNDPQLMPLAERFVSQKPERTPWWFSVRGHAYEFEQDDNWDRLEALLKAVAGREGVWFATLGEVHAALSDYARLEVGPDGSFLYNPSARDVHLVLDGQPLCVPAGGILRR